MSSLKIYNPYKNVYEAAKERVNFAFDHFKKIYVSYSGGKDSTVMLHMVISEARKRGVRVGVLIIDLEAQYLKTIAHMEELVSVYRDNIDLHWVCLPMSLRNAVSSFEPRWICWDEGQKHKWVRSLPTEVDVITEKNCPYPFFMKGMEFEEFMVLFGEWYSQGELTAAFVGIRANESLNRFRTIASKTKERLHDKIYTTKVVDNLYNIYPIYDWKTQDIWKFHAVNPEFSSNPVYDLMHRAGMSIHEMRLCQPYGDDQKKGLWLYHILEPQTWPKVVERVSGANSGALYINERGNINGYNKITKPENHTWESFCKLLLATMPSNSRAHFQERFVVFLKGWRSRGYINGIPDEAPSVLEKKMWAPSWRRLCRCLLRNDWWCKGLGLTQPKSEAYGKYLQVKKEGKLGERQAFEVKLDKSPFLDESSV